MFSTKRTVCLVVFFIGFVVTPCFSQAKSAIQFYDTTGQYKTGTFGWNGDGLNGHFFLQTSKGEIIITKENGLSVKGTIEGKNFIGDGSALTNLPIQTVKVVDVGGLQDSLNKKATILKIDSMQTQINTKRDSSWILSKILNSTDLSGFYSKPKIDTMLGSKADTNYVKTKIALKDSVRASFISDSCKYIPNNSVTSAKLSKNAIYDSNVVSINWNKITNAPELNQTLSATNNGPISPAWNAICIIDVRGNSGDVFKISFSSINPSNTAWIVYYMSNSGHIAIWSGSTSSYDGVFRLPEAATGFLIKSNTPCADGTFAYLTVKKIYP